VPPRYRKAEIKRLYGKGEVMVVSKVVLLTKIAQLQTRIFLAQAMSATL